MIGIFSGATVSADGSTLDIYSCDYPALKDIICDSKASADLDQNEVLIKKVYQFYNTIYLASNVVTGSGSKLYILNFGGETTNFQTIGLDYQISDFTVFPSKAGRFVQIFTAERSSAQQNSSGTIRGYKNSN